MGIDEDALNAARWEITPHLTCNKALLTLNAQERAVFLYGASFVSCSFDLEIEAPQGAAFVPSALLDGPDRAPDWLLSENRKPSVLKFDSPNGPLYYSNAPEMRAPFVGEKLPHVFYIDGEACAMFDRAADAMHQTAAAVAAKRGWGVSIWRFGKMEARYTTQSADIVADRPLSLAEAKRFAKQMSSLQDPHRLRRARPQGIAGVVRPAIATLTRAVDPCGREHLGLYMTDEVSKTAYYTVAYEKGYRYFPQVRVRGVWADGLSQFREFMLGGGRMLEYEPTVKDPTQKQAHARLRAFARSLKQNGIIVKETDLGAVKLKRDWHFPDHCPACRRSTCCWWVEPDEWRPQNERKPRKDAGAQPAARSYLRVILPGMTASEDAP